MSGGAADELRTLVVDDIGLSGSVEWPQYAAEWLVAYGEAVLALIEAAQGVNEQYRRGWIVSQRPSVEPPMPGLVALAVALERLTADAAYDGSVGQTKGDA